MTLDDLIRIADRFYPDGQILAHWDAQAHAPVAESRGDTLALFIVRELHATFDPDRPDLEQLIHAAEALRKASHELSGVIFGFDAVMRERFWSGP